MAPHGVYRCTGDARWCAIACETEAQWRALCAAMGQPGLASDSRYAGAEARKAHERELDSQVETWTEALEAYQVMERCQAAGVPAGVVQNFHELFGDPQLRHRRHFVYLDHPEMGVHATDSNCFILSESPAEYRRPAPLLGQHTRQVCAELLGMEESEIAELEAQGVLE